MAKPQDYILKKYVRARSAAEALKLDTDTEVSEVFLTTDKPVEGNTHAVGFTYYPPDPNWVPYEGQKS
jgi:hypothetical protein